MSSLQKIDIFESLGASKIWFIGILALVVNSFGGRGPFHESFQPNVGRHLVGVAPDWNPSTNEIILNHIMYYFKDEKS